MSAKNWMDEKIRNLCAPFGVIDSLKMPETKVSVEFENEILDENFHINPNIPGWQHHSEFSLRYCGFEFVLNNPASIKTVKKNIRDFWTEFYKLNNAELSNSRRTSTHIHFDVSQHTYSQVMNFAMMYWVLEEILAEFCTDERRGVHFALRAEDTIFPQALLAKELKQDKPFSSPLYNPDNGGAYRYLSVNFAAIQKFNSLEFRLMRGVDNAEEAIIWLEALEKIRKFTVSKFKTPLDLREFLIKESVYTLPESVLGTSLLDMKITLTTAEMYNRMLNAIEKIQKIFAAYEIYEEKQKGKVIMDKNIFQSTTSTTKKMTDSDWAVLALNTLADS